MIRPAVFSLVLGTSIVLFGSTSPVHTQTRTDPKGDLAAAKALYASASYEEALAKLPPDDGASDIEQVEPIRALCLLALGKTDEAQRVLERLVARRPLLVLSEADVSPRLVQIFTDLRRKLLPQAARAVYARAKGSYDAKQFASSASEFKFLLALLNDPLMADSAADFADLKMLADGFLKLSEAEVAATKPAAPAQPPAPANAGGTTTAPTTAITPAATPQTSAPSGPMIYSATDTDVKAPVEVTRQMPPWNPPNPTARMQIYRGLLEVIIDERGMVESAAIRRASFETYDSTLIDLTKQWRFRPARRGNEPVKYKMFYEILLRPPR
jgi:hypothetical protein